jgi:CheY-like chemotaxis protein
MNKRILLIEDDRISREFLHEALLPLAVPVDVADTLSQARLMAQQDQHALFLCDVHLPDGGPIDIFDTLRKLQSDTLLIALTAEAVNPAKQSLMNIGYQEVWEKPITMVTLQNNVARLLGVSNPTVIKEQVIECWDEASALRAVAGNHATLEALRSMFLSDLHQNMKTIEQKFNEADFVSLKSESHKLLAGCGFVGASGLAQAIKQLSVNPDSTEKMHEAMLQAKKCLSDF